MNVVSGREELRKAKPKTKPPRSAEPDRDGFLLLLERHSGVKLW
jgi:hypothetical protein